MNLKYLQLTIILLSLSQGLKSQTMQIKFCGKTSNVIPTNDNSGNDQRHKGGLRLDLIRIGKLSQSRTAPFYSLGVAPNDFLNGTWVDGCINNTNATYCTGCTTCKTIKNTSNADVGSAEGKMESNVRMRTNNNDLFIESTGTQNVVCFRTNNIDVSAQAGKKIEVNIKYEGTALDGFTTVNVNTQYRYNSGAWEQVFNQNSNFLRVIDTALLIPVNVPVAVENLDGVLHFEVSPNPVNEKLFIDVESKKSFQGVLTLRDLNGKLISEQELFIKEGNNNFDINARELQYGVYLLQIGDLEGRISTKKFVKE
jgi:hypothetical protein